MSLSDLRDAVESALDANVKPLAAVHVHGGQFGLAELRRYAIHAPCAVLSLRSIPAVEYEGGQVVASIEWAVYLIARDAVNAKKDAIALSLVEAALGVITPEQRWGGEASHPPESIKAPNLYSGDLDKVGIAFWAITWTQKQDIQRVDVSELADFLRYRATTTVEGAEQDDTPKMDSAVDLPAEDA